MSIFGLLARRVYMSWCSIASPAALSIVRPQGPLVEPGSPAAQIEVPPALAARWAALPPSARRYLTAYLGPAPCLTIDCPDRVEIAAPPQVPAPFRDDLARGGRQLRAALPDLARTVMTLEEPHAGALCVELVCEATHDAPFFGFLLPTRRRVRFREFHRLVVGERVLGERTLAGQLLEDHVSIDVRAIIRQLATS